MPRELWRPIPAFPTYEVSSLGRVRRGARVLSTHLSDNGYVRVKLFASGQRRNARVHLLVLETFVGPGGGLEGAHKNGDKSNNTLSNLVWKTRSENERDKKRHGTHTRVVGVRKLTHAQRFMIALALSSGASKRSLAKQFGVSRGAIYRIQSSIHAD